VAQDVQIRSKQRVTLSLKRGTTKGTAMPLPRPLVIYVEHDDPVVEQTLLEFLTDLGHTAVPIGSDDDLLAKLAASDPKPDVLITSLAGGDGDGFDLLRQTHQQHPEVALILITNGGRSLTASEAAPCGVTALLREPIRLSELELYLTRL
jgi:DNA-binding NtrC family response regulator